MTYPSSVNRGYFSYLARIMLMIPPLFVSILCQSRLFLLPCSEQRRHYRFIPYPSSVNRGYFSYTGSCGLIVAQVFVSILCQSRLFLLPGIWWMATLNSIQKYPSSVNRGYFSYARTLAVLSAVVIVSILCQSRLFLLPQVAKPEVCWRSCIHPLSIEAISPTMYTLGSTTCNTNAKYPSSVNRGYFSYSGFLTNFALVTLASGCFTTKYSRLSALLGTIKSPLFCLLDQL